MTYACPTKYNTEFKQILDKYGNEMAARIWGVLGDAITDSTLVQQTIDAFQSQEKIKQSVLDSDSVKKIVAKLMQPEIQLDGKNYKVLSTNAIVKNRVSNYKRQYELEVQGYSALGSASTFYAAKGTAVHAYLEHIVNDLKSGKVPQVADVWNRVYNELRLHPDFKEYDKNFYEIKPAQFNNLVSASQTLIKHIRDTQKSIDAKGKVEIFTEVPVFDALYDEAGTIDLLAVYSDGTASIYDFKSYVGQPKKEPSMNKVEGWEIQMQNYKNMLKRAYGVKGFRESRVIPLQVQYNKYNKDTKTYEHKTEGFEKLVIQTVENSEEYKYLNQIPIQEFTGNENTDKVLQNLYAQIKNKRALQLREKNDKTRNYFKLGREINRHKKAIDEILLYRNINGVIDIVATLTKNINKRMGKNVDEELHISLSEAKDLLDELNLYNNLQLLYAQEIEAIEDKDQKAKVIARLSNMNNAISLTSQKLKQIILENLAPDIQEEGNTPGSMGRIFKGISDYNMPIFRELTKYVRYAGEKTRRDSLRDIKEIQKIDEAFDKWAKANGYNSLNKFDLVYDSNRGELINEFTSEYYDMLRTVRKKVNADEKLTTEEADFIKNNFEFDKEKHDNVQQRVFKEIDKDVFEGVITQETAKTRKAQYEKNHTVIDNQGNFLLSNKFLYDFIKPKLKDTKYRNTKYDFIMNNKPVKDYYMMYINMNEQFNEVLPNKKISKYFVPHVQQNVLDRLTEFGSISGMQKAFERAYALREQDAVMGVRDAVTGEYKQEIPLLFSDPIRKPLSDSAEAKIHAEVADIFDKGTPEYNAEVKRRIDRQEKQEGLAIKSRDLTKSLMLFVNAAHDYTNLSSIEGHVKAMKYLVENQSVASTQLNSNERKVLNKFTKDLVKTQKGLTPEVVKAFDDWVDVLVYKRRFEKDTNVLGDKSMNKIGMSLMNYLSLKALGLDFLITTANFIQARSGLYIKSKENIHFGNVEIKDTVASFTPRSKRDSQYNMLIDFFQTSTRDLVKEEIDKSGATVGSRVLTERTAFIGYAIGEDNVDNLLTVAMSKRYVIDSDGKIKNPKTQTIIDPNVKTVYDSIEMVNNQPMIKGLSLEAAADFRAKIQKVSYQVKGMTTEETKGLYQRNLALSAAMQFKSWIPGLYQQRLSELRYDETLETFDIGTFRVGFGEMFGKGLMPSLKNALKLMVEVSGLKRATVDSEIAKAQLEQFLMENPNYYGKVTLEELIAIKEAKLRSLIQELRVYLAIALLVQLIGGLDWDDEETGNILTWSGDQVIRRALLEISFWYSPNSATQIVRSPLPLSGIFVDLFKLMDNTVVEGSRFITGYENPYDKTPLGYYTLKATPVANQVGELTGFLNRYNRPKTLLEQIFTEGN